jgi:hypothetical protein
MAPSASSIEEVEYLYKSWWTTRRLMNSAERDHPRFKRLRKIAGFPGANGKYPVQYGHPQGIGGTYAGAKATATGSKGIQFEAGRKTKRGVITLDGESIDAAADKDGGIADLVRTETTGIIYGLGESFAFDAYRDGTGLRGVVADITGNVVTLETPSDARNFPIGMTAIADNNANGLSPIAGSGVVKSLNPQAGQVEFEDIATFTGVLAVGHNLFRYDDPGSCMEGLAVCTPLVAPTPGDSFRGQDRSRHVELLAGCRIDNTALTVEDAIMQAAVACGINRKKLTHVWVNPDPFHNMTRRAGAQVIYKAGGKLEQGFETAVIVTAYGALEVVADPDCQPDIAWGTNEEEEEIRYLGKGLPFIVAGKNGDILHDADNDGIEVRLRGPCNYFQWTPGNFFAARFGS